MSLRLLRRRHLEHAARHWAARANRQFIDQMKLRSMLHQETLALLDYLARRVRHGILEIGPYTGAATVVMATALAESGRTVPFISVEMGGSHSTHPQLPSDDILADLRKTLDEHGVASRVDIVEGISGQPQVTESIRLRLNGQSVDLLLIDADGNVDRDYSLYQPFLAAHAVIVCDDYTHEGARSKQEPVRLWVDKPCREGLVRDLGVYQWGTWFGQLT